MRSVTHCKILKYLVLPRFESSWPHQLDRVGAFIPGVSAKVFSPSSVYSRFIASDQPATGFDVGDVDPHKVAGSGGS